MSVEKYTPDCGLTLDEAMEELVGAEDFLVFFDVPFDQTVVHVNRLHIMQRYHDYLSKAGDLDEYSDEVLCGIYRKLLVQAYEDFVNSDAKTEKALKIYKMGDPQTTFVPLDQLFS